MAAKVKTKPAPRLAEPIRLPAGTETALSRRQIADALSISMRAFDSLVSTGKYPEPNIRIGASVRWRQETHNEWVLSNLTPHGKG